MGRSGTCASDPSDPTVDSLTPYRFFRGFVYELCLRGRDHVSVYSTQDRAGWYRVHEFLEQAVDRVANDSDWRYAVVRLRNSTAPSNNGAFDSVRGYLIEQTATSLQFSDIWANPPFFVIRIGRVYAEACLNDYPEPARTLIQECVNAFLG